MADVSISGLTAATSLTGAEELPLVQAGVTKRATVTLARGPAVTGTAPISVTSGAVSISAASSSNPGSMSAADKVKLDSGTATGLSVFQASSASAARTAIGAVALGTTSTTAKAGDYQPSAANITDATDTGRALITAADAAAVRTAAGLDTTIPAAVQTELNGKMDIGDAIGIASLPAGSVLAVRRDDVAGTWPVSRPTTRLDITVFCVTTVVGASGPPWKADIDLLLVAQA